MICPEFHFPMEASLRWSGAESQSDPRIAINGTPYLLRAPTNAECHEPLYVALEVGNQTFTNKVEAHSTTQLEAPNKSPRLPKPRRQQIPSRVPMNPRGNKIRKGLMRGESKLLWWKCRSRSPPSLLKESRCLGQG